MKIIIQIIRPLVLVLLVLANFVSSTFAQEVSIPDPNLNAVVRAALQKPNGPLTQSDMLGLTGLSAIFRISYGDDDPNYTSLTNYAWFLDFAHLDLTVHPVGQKLPNPWGIYDMHGNVWEWCQDWYGDQTGGVQTDPTGPVSNPNGNKVMRGGAYDYANSDCRSASRFFRFALSPDSDVGFRVVLVTEP